MSLIISDIDGTIFGHHGSIESIMHKPMEILPGVKEKFDTWRKNGDCIMLVTAREEYMRQLTQYHLSQFNIPYDHLIMGVGNGLRYLINDTKPYAGLDETCFAITVPRDKGLTDIILPYYEIHN